MSDKAELKEQNTPFGPQNVEKPLVATSDTVGNDSAVFVKVSGPCAWDLEQLNLAIGNLNAATAAVEKIGELVKSLDGFHQQLTAPNATPRQAALLQSEAAAIDAELSKTLADESLVPFGKNALNFIGNDSSVTKQRIEQAQKYNSELKTNIDQKRAGLNHDLALLETAHLNSQSSKSAVRDLESALSLMASTRTALAKSPGHAVEACGALGARARSLLLNG